MGGGRGGEKGGGRGEEERGKREREGKNQFLLCKTYLKNDILQLGETDIIRSRPSPSQESGVNHCA